MPNCWRASSLSKGEYIYTNKYVITMMTNSATFSSTEWTEFTKYSCMLFYIVGSGCLLIKV